MEREAATEFKAKFVARTAAARARAGFTQETIAAALGMKQAKYHKYEKRTLLPHVLVMQFCLLCRITPEWLYASAIEVAPTAPKPRKSRGPRKPRRKAA